MKPKVILLMAMSVDGYITKHQDGLVDWTSKEDKAHFVRVTKEAGVIIYGKKTFEQHHKPLPKRLNVVMTRNPQAHLNQPGLLEYTNLEPRALIKSLEEQGHQTIIVAGGAEINSLFIKENLIDEIMLTVEPKLFGNGKRLFSEINLEIPLELVDMKMLNQHSVLLNYRIVK